MHSTNINIRANNARGHTKSNGRYCCLHSSVPDRTAPHDLCLSRRRCARRYLHWERISPSGLQCNSVCVFVCVQFAVCVSVHKCRPSGALIIKFCENDHVRTHITRTRTHAYTHNSKTPIEQTPPEITILQLSATN